MAKRSLVPPPHRRLCGVVAIGAMLATSVVATTAAPPTLVLALPGPTESTVVTVDPTRVLDTRFDVGITGKIVAGTAQKLQVTGTVDTWIEATKVSTPKQVVPIGATGVLLNVTAVSPSAPGFLSIRPGSATGDPATAGLNFDAGDVVPNGITVAVPTSGANAGQIDLYFGAATPGATMDVVADIVGYTTNIGLLDLVQRVTVLETSGVQGDPGPQGVPGKDAESPARVVWVADDGSGDFTLLSAALASVADASASKPYVIKIAPGTYIESSSVALRSFVDIEGSGQGTTTITCACGSGSTFAASATVTAGNINAEIRDLTIRNTGGASQFISVGMSTSAASSALSLRHVTVVASGGSLENTGVYNNSASAPAMNNVTTTGTGGGNSYGVLNEGAAAPTMNNVTAAGTGSAGNNMGIRNDGASSSNMNDVTAIASGGFYTFGVFNDGASPTMNNMTITASGGSNTNHGVFNRTAMPTIRNSSITGITAAIINENLASTARVAHTVLAGPATGTGFTCIGVHTPAFAALNVSCV